MKYLDLLKNGASPTEIRSYLVDGDNVSLTMRIPEPMRDSMKEAAELQGMSMTSFVKQCVLDKLSNEKTSR